MVVEISGIMQAANHVALYIQADGINIECDFDIDDWDITSDSLTIYDSKGSKFYFKGDFKEDDDEYTFAIINNDSKVYLLIS